MNKPTFFMDTHIKAAASKQLRLHGMDILRCEDVDMENDDDSDLLAYAAEHHRVMVSCDDDFEDLHYQYLEQGKAHSGIILCKQLRHCQNIGRLVKIIIMIHELADETDLYNQLEHGEDYE